MTRGLGTRVECGVGHTTRMSCRGDLQVAGAYVGCETHPYSWDGLILSSVLSVQWENSDLRVKELLHKERRVQ